MTKPLGRLKFLLMHESHLDHRYKEFYGWRTIPTKDGWKLQVLILDDDTQNERWFTVKPNAPLIFYTKNIIESIDTINVIEECPEPLQIISYPNTEEGNRAAQKIFREIIQENADVITEEQLENAIKEGYYQSGNFKAILIHSTIYEN